MVIFAMNIVQLVTRPSGEGEKGRIELLRLLRSSQQWP